MGEINTIIWPKQVKDASSVVSLCLHLAIGLLEFEISVIEMTFEVMLGDCTQNMLPSILALEIS